MEKFKLIKNSSQSINRNIRLSNILHKEICIISKATGISYNKIVIKCIEYALSNMK